ncbi:SDR family oxidoreductase [Phreatobacter stygius]|nr:SDR family NAD(P)-dependent oxidoreductase [Phreatobacter stygius]
MPHPTPVVIVTGATGNVGRALLPVLADRGMTVVAVARGGAALTEALANLPAAASHLAIPDADLLDPAACRKVVSDTLARFGRIDGLAHTVGGFAAAPAADGGTDLWDQMFRLNTLTTLNIVQAALPPMRAAQRGSLVAIAAGAGLKAPSGLAAYAASKSAVLRLVESFAAELKSEGVRVNAVLPGTIDTPQNRAAMPKANPSAWVLPSEVAEAMAFLLADSASGITGAALPVNGRG